MRFVSVAVCSAMVLASCGGSGGRATGPVACTQQFWNGVIGLCLPAGWGVLEREKLDERGAPDQVMVGFQSEKTVSGQTPTVTVTVEKLPVPLDTPAYSKASIRSVAGLPGYKLVDSRPMVVEAQDSELHIFTAQPVPGQPERRFYQLSAVAANIGYTVTALTPVSISDSLEKELLLMFNSVRFSEPAASEQ